jgi:hypothetical protein
MSEDWVAENFQDFGDVCTILPFTGLIVYETDWIFIYRFIVRNFVTELPEKWGPFVLSAPGFLACDLTSYSVLGITVFGLEPLKTIEVLDTYYGPATTNKVIMSDERSWAIDFVIQPNVNEKSWGSPDEWKKYLTDALYQWTGYRPTVDVYCVTRLPTGRRPWGEEKEEEYKPLTDWYYKLFNYWKKRTPVISVEACPEDMEKTMKCPIIKRTQYGDAGWRKGFLGEDGHGLAWGFATDDENEPIEVLGHKKKSLQTKKIGKNGKRYTTERIAGETQILGVRLKYSNLVLLGFAGLGFYLFNELYKDE